MKKTVFSFVFLIALILQAEAQIAVTADLLKLAKESIEISFDKKEISIELKKVQKADNLFFEFVKFKINDNQYYALIDEVKGKSHLITYMVTFSISGEIQDMDVLVYRESYGGEIDYKVFRNQFKGKNITESLKPGKNIRNISGATISVNAVTRGIQKLLETFEWLKKENKL